MNRVVITGMGWITPMGHSIEAVWQRLLKGESGIAPTSLFDASTFPTRISAEVKNFHRPDRPRERRPPHGLRARRLRPGLEGRRPS